MKKIWLFILSLFTLSCVWNLTQANNEYEYTNLDITANILNDGTIDVNENFTADFFVSKHWIIRDIPLNYSVWWKSFHIDVSNINVQWKNFTTSKNNWNIEIKIWDANRTVIWKQNYPISYSTYGLIRNFSWMWYAELYWNLVGYDFDTNINKVRAELNLPKTYTWFTKDDFLITTDWTAKTIDWFAWTVDWGRWNKIIITYDKWLPAYHGITLAIKFPNGYFQFDHNRQTSLIKEVSSWFTKETTSNRLSKIKNIPTKIIIRLFSFIWISSIIFWIIRTKNSRNINLNQWKLKWAFAEKYPTIIQYTPPKGINSAEAWLLLHRWAKAKDLFSLIYERASKNYINIRYNSKSSISLFKENQIEDNSPEYEKKFFNVIIPKSKREIKEGSPILKFNIKRNELLWDLEDYWNNKWWFTWNKKTTSFNTIWCLYILILFMGLPILWIISINLSIMLFLILRCIWFFWWILWLFNKKLDLSDEWAKLTSHILWYREFLATCDENKLRLFLQQDPLYFDKTLPYAIVFWLESELIEKFIPIMQEMNISPIRYDWDATFLSDSISTISSISSWSSLYSSDSWFDSGSSFDSGWGGFSSGWGGWWWGWSSW